MFKVVRIGSNVEKEFDQVFLANIIEPRVQEIFHLVKNEVKRLGFTELPGGYILSGGTVSMAGVLNAAQAELQTSVRIAVPDYIGVRDPGFVSGVGVLHHVMRSVRPRSAGGTKKAAARKPAPAESSNKPGFIERLKNMFSEFI